MNTGSTYLFGKPDDLERIEKKYANPQKAEEKSCSDSDSCENCEYNDGDCCRLIYEAKMKSKEQA